MNAKELRIGNYHEIDPISITRTATHSLLVDGRAFAAITSYGIHLADEGKLNFKPIPLTDEWLYKLGLELEDDNGDDKYFQFKGHEYGVHSIDDNDFYFYKGQDFVSTLKQIYWVHELQNLIFALTNKELTFQQTTA